MTVRSALRGEARLRRKLKAMPDIIQDEVKRAIRTETLLARDAVRAAAPVSTEGVPHDWQGNPRKHLVEGIKARFSSKGLRGAVGIFRKDKQVFFFARFLEYGFRGRGTKRNGKRGPPKPTKITKHKFFWKAWSVQRPQARAHVILATKKAFQKAAKL